MTERVRLHVRFQGEVNQYRIILGSTANDQFFPQAEYLSYWNKMSYAQPMERPLRGFGDEAGIVGSEGGHIASYVRGHLHGWRIYHFHDTSSNSPFKKTGDVHDNRFLRPDGSNLASFLYFLREKHPTEYDLIRRTVQFAAPFLEDFRLEPLALNPDKIRLEWRHKGSEAYFDASGFSDETL